MEVEIFKDYYIKQGIRSINLSKRDAINNIYFYQILRTLFPDKNIDEFFKKENLDNLSELELDSVRKDIFGVLDSFFRNSWMRKDDKESDEPEISGGLSSNLLAGFSFTNSRLAIETESQIPATTTYFIASDKVYPLQFIVSTSQLKISLDEKSDFDINRDFLFFCIRPGGFILSLDMEMLGVFVGIMGDIVKTKETTAEGIANAMFKPTAQERMYSSWTEFFLYLKEKDLINSSIFAL